MCNYMSITVNELKINIEKYLVLATTEDVFITHNGKIIAKLTNPSQQRMDVVNSLFGIISSDTTLDDAYKKRTNGL